MQRPIDKKEEDGMLRIGWVWFRLTTVWCLNKWQMLPVPVPLKETHARIMYKTLPLVIGKGKRNTFI